MQSNSVRQEKAVEHTQTENLAELRDPEDILYSFKVIECITVKASFVTKSSTNM